MNERAEAFKSTPDFQQFGKGIICQEIFKLIIPR